jgi:DNA-directed RNA polymerase subunit RPC12/RpoP
MAGAKRPDLSKINTATKSKPKEIRTYVCSHCGKTIEKLEHVHHAIKEHYTCRSCIAKINGAKSAAKRKGLPNEANKGKIPWNKGKKQESTAGENNPMKRDASRHKMSQTVSGRKRLYDENGKWTWFYPTSISIDCLGEKEQS